MLPLISKYAKGFNKTKYMLKHDELLIKYNKI